MSSGTKVLMTVWVMAGLAMGQAAGPAGSAAMPTVWRFDNVASVGGNAAEVLGHPAVIETAIGKVVQFNGVDDALLMKVHPLAGAETWTWEMIFRPDADGKAEQRVFHLQSVDPATGTDAANERMLFEIRIREGKWCLDSFATVGGQSRALLNCEKVYPFGRWYRVTTVYDGTTLRNYVGDELQGEGPLTIPAARPGRSSVGTRINLRDYYKGAMYAARFTRSALKVGEFMQMPAEKAR